MTTQATLTTQLPTALIASLVGPRQGTRQGNGVAAGCRGAIRAFLKTHGIRAKVRSAGSSGTEITVPQASLEEAKRLLGLPTGWIGSTTYIQMADKNGIRVPADQEETFRSLLYRSLGKVIDANSRRKAVKKAIEDSMGMWDSAHQGNRPYDRESAMRYFTDENEFRARWGRETLAVPEALK